MRDKTIFNSPIIASLSSVEEETVFDFKRKTLFLPGTSGNDYLKFSFVFGDKGATSRMHTHPGDEIVFTLEGENINYFKSKEVLIKKNMGLSISPHTAHRTTVTGSTGWKGISIYCDECPLLLHKISLSPSDTCEKRSPNYQNLCQEKHTSADLLKIELFSPVLGNSAYVELYSLSGPPASTESQFTPKGETIYFILSGKFLLSSVWGTLFLKPGVAIAIPQRFCHTIQTEKDTGGQLIAASCSFCPLLESFSVET